MSQQPNVPETTISLDAINDSIRNVGSGNPINTNRSNFEIQEIDDQNTNHVSYDIDNLVTIPNPQTQVQQSFQTQVQESVETSNVGYKEQAETIDYSPEQYQLEVYNAAFNFLKENELTVIPPDITEVSADTLDKIIEYNKALQYTYALEDIKSRAGDSSIAELFELVYNGGTIDDLALAKDIITEERDIKSYDTSDEEHAKALVKMYWSNDLDPSNPAHERLLKNIDSDIQKAIDRMELTEEADKAKAYLLKQIEDDKKEFKKRKEAEQNARQEMAIRQDMYRREWNEKFKSSLASKSFSKEKQDTIIRQFDEVTLDNGATMTLWEYKMEKMWQNPEQIITLMNFLSDYDERSLMFKTKEAPVTKQATEMLLKIANSKTTTTKPAGFNNPKVDSELIKSQVIQSLKSF